MHRTIVPCLWLDREADDAAALHTRVFPGGRVLARSHYPATMDNPPGKPRGSVLTVEVELAGQPFTLLNGGPQFRPSPTVSFFVFVPSAAEADRVFGALETGGSALMPLDRYPWSPRYGWIQDRFGVSWQVMFEPGRTETTIAPCLMFAGAQHGRAEEALKAYASIFPSSRIEAIDRYAASEGPEGTVKHGRATIAGQTLAAMDSHLAHGMTFDEGVSLQVMCRDQAELDRYWRALSEGGAEGPCGWLKDRFGLSWQVVPSDIAKWLTSSNTAANDRAFAAVMKMGKLDVAAIEAAFEGR